jgi:hypothetical protein
MLKCGWRKEGGVLAATPVHSYRVPEHLTSRTTTPPEGINLPATAWL